MKKQRNINLAIASMVMLSLAACSSNDDPSNEPVNPNPTTVLGRLGLTINPTQGRVHNLLTGTTSAKTRAASVNAPALSFSIPAVPTYSEPYNEEAKLTKDVTFQANHRNVSLETLDLNGHNIVVRHELTLGAIKGTGNIYVSGPSAKLILNTGNIPAGVNIYVYKNTSHGLTVNTEALNIAEGASLVTEDAKIFSLDLPNATLVNNGKLYVNADQDGLRVKSAVLGAGSETYVKDNFRIQAQPNGVDGEYGDLTVAGKLTVGRTLWAKNITVDNGGVIVNNGKINANGDMTVDGAETKVYANYIKVGELDSKPHTDANGVTTTGVKTTLTQSNGSQIILGSNGVIAAYNYNNKDNGNAFIDLDASNAKAVLNVVNLSWNTGSPAFLHTSGTTANATSLFGVHFVNASLNGAAQDWDDLGFDAGNVRKIRKENEFADFSIPADASIDFGGFNAAGEGDGSKTNYQVIRPIAEVTYGTSDASANGLSATCVQVDGDKAYVSYHTNGGTQAGRLEVIETNGTNVQLLQSISATGAANQVDWNHIALDKTRNRLVGVGNSQKGGLLTTVDLKDDGTFNTTATTTADSTLEPLRYVILQKVPGQNNTSNVSGDGNAVIVNNGYYQVASTYGEETFDASTLEGAYTQQFGRGKHIAMGNGTVALATLDERPTSIDQHVNMTIGLYPASQVRLDSPSSTFSAGEIYPNNGKNVVAVDGSDIYVCTSTEGLKVYNGGSLSWSFKPADATYTVKEQQEGETYPVGTVVARGLCNGVYVGSKYVYVAYGSLGLIVLDKTTHQEVARYNAGRSANFVSVTSDGTIYLAYGKNRLKVLQLEERNY